MPVTPVRSSSPPRASPGQGILACSASSTKTPSIPGASTRGASPKPVSTETGMSGPRAAQKPPWADMVTAPLGMLGHGKEPLRNLPQAPHAQQQPPEGEEPSLSWAAPQPRHRQVTALPHGDREGLATGTSPCSSRLTHPRALGLHKLSLIPPMVALRLHGWTLARPADRVSIPLKADFTNQEPLWEGEESGPPPPWGPFPSSQS